MPRIEGVVDDVVFRNESNGWTVLAIKAGRERFSAVGSIAPINAGERVAIEGEWAEHPDYGRQIKIGTLESIRPTTASGIERYLGSGVIRGVGPATAKLIVHQFGTAALDVLDMNPERLCEIPGIGPKRAEMIAESYRQQRAARMTMLFLQTYGLTAQMAAKVYKTLGDKTQELVRQNPYILVDKVDGIGFKTADAIAFSLGIEKESEYRIRAGLQYVISEAVNSAGHTYLPLEMLTGQAQRVLEVDESLVDDALRGLALDFQLIRTEVSGEVRVYLPQMYEAEGEVARRIVDRLSVLPLERGRQIDAHIERFQKRQRVELSREQREAVHASMESALTIVTGGPGTGKTTVIRCIIELLDLHGEVSLCAPTGRAAKRMSEATGREAKTMHRLLEYGGEEGAFQRNQDAPLGADAVIVDEMSMVDLFLMRSLLRALKSGARLVMVGDANQLPSVGAGNVLKDLISSQAIPTVCLTEIFRQAQQSMIVMNAHKILHGSMPQLNGKGTDFFMERTQLPQQAAQTVLALTASRLPNYMGLDSLRDIQVLAPMKKGDAGVFALNRLLQDRLNPRADSKLELNREGALIREGDKVMQMRNNYELEWRRGGEAGEGVFNGDIGFVCRIDLEERSVEVLFDDDRVCEYAEGDLEDLELAYCMSVHKSQGSEFECVVMPVMPGPPMLYTRNLLYTAVTRAKRLVVLVGRENCVEQMVNNDHIAKRYSALSERVAEMARSIK